MSVFKTYAYIITAIKCHFRSIMTICVNGGLLISDFKIRQFILVIARSLM